jgi:hypothetical protein
MLEYAIAAGLASAGADAYMLHVTTTPSVSYVTASDGFNIGIMISASHNPYYDNGIKLVDNRNELETKGFAFKYHGWSILHGHELGICPVTDPARRYLERAKTNIIVGHIHKTDSRIMTTLDGQIIRCCSIGTLAKRNPQYMPFNAWIQGFAIMEHSGSWFQPDIVHNFSICKGMVI